MCIEIPAGTETILQYAIRNGLELPSECCSGVCGACRVRLLSGKTDEIKTALGWHDSDEVLACCSIPVTTVRVEVPISPVHS